jgi:hypothetical protein
VVSSGNIFKPVFGKYESTSSLVEQQHARSAPTSAGLVRDLDDDTPPAQDDPKNISYFDDDVEEIELDTEFI